MSKESGLSKITTDSLVQILDTDSDLFLLDVREPDEVAEWRIPGVNNIPLGELDRRISEVPTDKHVVVICAKGARALQGAQILLDHGVGSEVLEGGMGAWA